MTVEWQCHDGASGRALLGEAVTSSQSLSAHLRHFPDSCGYAFEMISPPRELGNGDGFATIEVAQIRVGHRIVLAVSGELDLATVGSLRASLEAAVESGAAEIWVDLSEVAFMDSTGLRVVLDARSRLRAKAKTLAVICPLGPVRRVFTVAGLDHQLNIYGDRAAAHAAG